MQGLRHDVRSFIFDNFLFGQAPAGVTLSDDQSLLEAGIIDSTGILELVMFVETHCGITIADEELIPDNLDSISRLVQFVERKRNLVSAAGA